VDLAGAGMLGLRNHMPQDPDTAKRHLDLDALAAAAAEVPGFEDVTLAELEPLRVKGLAHDHVALRGRAVLLRVPKQSQFALSAATNLAYQAACFERVSASGHGTRLHDTITPQPRIPMGALLVDHIDGRPPRLPEDLAALAECMAWVHALPLPPARERPPLADHRDPVGGAMAEIEAQALFLDDAGLSFEARAEIEDELTWARAYQGEIAGMEQPVTLVLTDTHPGNFLIDKQGRAIIVDLEKALYGSPGTDLAHATIYSSTTWDTDTWADLGLDEVAAFYRHYLALLDPDLAERLRPWLVPLRRVTMLRAITWCVKWQVLHQRERREAKHAAASTEDWSAENTDPALIAHVAGRVAEYLSAPILRRMRAEWLGKPGLEEMI
jgi:aminoglycoside phosphotransferase (APT) family kinase protein